DELDAGLAAKSMELMARTLGIGSLLVGIFTTFANKSRSTKAYLGVARREKIVACLALGYPDVKYVRTVPRRKANVIWR
ncbi:4Fe-4S dicluster domain-containing protein, partial [Aduncisulcus paluster]